jgi:hypothetical protein
MSAAPGSQRARAASDPNFAIIPAHMLWIDKKAATAGHAIDSPSNTSVPSSLDSPVPPISS